MRYVSGGLKSLGRYALPPLILSLSMFVCTLEREYLAPTETTVVREYRPATPTARKTRVPEVQTATSSPLPTSTATPVPLPTPSLSPTPIPLVQYDASSDCVEYTVTPTAVPVLPPLNRPAIAVTPTSKLDIASTPGTVHSSDDSLSSAANYSISYPQVLSDVCGIYAKLPVENPDLALGLMKHYVRSIAVSDGLYLSGGRGLEIGWVKCNYAEEHNLPCSEPALFVARYYGGDIWGRTFYDIDIGDSVEVAIANNLPENSDAYIWYALVRINGQWGALYKDKLEFSTAPRAVEMIENYDLR